MLVLQSVCHFAGAQPLQFSWGKSMGGPNAIGNAAATIINITHDAAGNVIVAGTFQDTVDFDPGPGVANLQSLNGTDVFVLKLDVQELSAVLRYVLQGQQKQHLRNRLWSTSDQLISLSPSC